MASNNHEHHHHSIRNKLLGLGRPENRVRPADNQQAPDLTTRPEQAEHGKNAGRPYLKPPRKSVGKKMKIIKGDIAQTPLETWLTFAFTIAVGSFLLGGGIFLIIHGTENNVFDFVVVGGCAIAMGICFTAMSSFMLFRPVYVAYKERKATEREEKRRQELEDLQNEAPPFTIQDQMTAYITKSQAALLTHEISGRLLNRSPDNKVLYDQEYRRDPDVAGFESRLQSASSTASSCDPPPPVAIPTKGKLATDRKHSIIFKSMEVRESTADDIAVISQMAEKKNVTSGQAQNGTAAEVSVDPSVTSVDATQKRIITSGPAQKSIAEAILESSSTTAAVGLSQPADKKTTSSVQPKTTVSENNLTPSYIPPAKEVSKLQRDSSPSMSVIQEQQEVSPSEGFESVLPELGTVANENSKIRLGDDDQKPKSDSPENERPDTGFGSTGSGEIDNREERKNRLAALNKRTFSENDDTQNVPTVSSSKSDHHEDSDDEGLEVVPH